jgi:2-dehydro-3-deoxygluconokinase
MTDAVRRGAAPATVVTFGEAMLRLTVPGHGRLEDVEALQVNVAGAELNVAVALARLGVAASWISAVPDSPIGRRLESSAVISGVDIASVIRIPGSRLGVFYVEYGVAPRPISVWYDRADSAFALMDSFDFGPMVGARYAVVSGITPGLGSRSAAATRAFLDAAKANGVQVCLDVNYRERLWTADEARQSLGALVHDSDVVVCSARDARRVFRCDGADEDILLELSQRWCPDARVVVLTLGSEGALGQADGVSQRQTAFKAEVVDRFGAGDAFTAGLLWGLIHGDLSHALRAGAALAALKCTVPGDQARFSQRELEAVMNGASVGITR